MIYEKQNTAAYVIDNSNALYKDNLENAIRLYYRRQGRTDQELSQIDINSNIHNALWELIRFVDIGERDLVEYITYTITRSVGVELKGEHLEKYMRTHNKVNKSINNAVKNSMEV